MKVFTDRIRDVYTCYVAYIDVTFELKDVSIHFTTKRCSILTMGKRIWKTGNYVVLYPGSSQSNAQL